jgi:hypothetical protein
MVPFLYQNAAKISFYVNAVMAQVIVGKFLTSEIWTTTKKKSNQTDEQPTTFNMTGITVVYLKAL